MIIKLAKNIVDGTKFSNGLSCFLFEIPKTIWTASELSYVFRRQWWLRRMSMSIASHSNSEEHIFIYDNNQTNIRSQPPSWEKNLLWHFIRSGIDLPEYTPI